METVREPVQSYADPRDGDPLDLWGFLSESMFTGSCFCCGCSTELSLDGSGRALVSCPACGAEVSGDEASRITRDLPVLQAA